MSYTLSDLRTDARGLLSEEGDEFFRSALFTSWANRALDLVFADAPWIWVTSAFRWTVVGVPSYRVPPRMQVPKATYLILSSGIGYRVNEWPMALVDQYRQYAAKRPTENIWMCGYRQTELGTSVELVYEPSAPLLMQVVSYQVPKHLSSDTDVADGPDWARPLIVQRILVEAKKKDEETAQAGQAMTEYKDILKDVRATRMRKQMDMINIARPMRGFLRGRMPWY